jgi:type VI secretion system protein VasI
VVLNADNRQIRSHWFIRENGYLLEASRGLSVLTRLNSFLAQKR